MLTTKLPSIVALGFMNKVSSFLQSFYNHTPTIPRGWPSGPCLNEKWSKGQRKRRVFINRLVHAHLRQLRCGLTIPPSVYCRFFRQLIDLYLRSLLRFKVLRCYYLFLCILVRLPGTHRFMNNLTAKHLNLNEIKTKMNTMLFPYSLFNLWKYFC